MPFICCAIFSKYFMQVTLPNILYFFYFKSIIPWYRFLVKSTILKYVTLSFHCFNCYTKLSKSSIKILGTSKKSFSLKLFFCKVNFFFFFFFFANRFVLMCCNLWEGTNTGATNICDTGHWNCSNCETFGHNKYIYYNFMYICILNSFWLAYSWFKCKW